MELFSSSDRTRIVELIGQGYHQINWDNTRYPWIVTCGPPAAEASVFNGCCLQNLSSPTWCLPSLYLPNHLFSSCQSNGLQRRINGNFVYDVASTVAPGPESPDFTEDGVYNKISQMLSYFYGDIVGLEGASGLRTSPAGGASAKEMSSTRLRRRRQHQPLLSHCASSREEWCPPRWRASHASGRWGCRSWRRRSCAQRGRRAAPGGCQARPPPRMKNKASMSLSVGAICTFKNPSAIFSMHTSG